MLDLLELNPSSSPDTTIIWLHGLGAGQHDLVPLASLLSLPNRRLRHVFPQAPTRAVSLNNDYRMPAWFDLSARSTGLVEDEPEVLAAVGELNVLIEAEIARGLAPKAIVVAGFSQGGALALSCGIMRRRPIGAIVVLSGWLPCAATIEAHVAEAAKQTPIFYAHGQYDSVVPLSLVQSSRARLLALGFDLSARDYPIDHTISEQEIADLDAWLGMRLDTTN